MEKEKNREMEMLNAELEAIIETALDEIFVTDQNGVITRVNSVGRRYYNTQGKSLIGMHVEDLFNQGIISTSGTLKVIEQKAPVEIFQKTNTGSYLHVRSYPLFDKEGKLFRIVSYSKDLTELLELKKKIESMEEQLENYKKENSQSIELDGIVSKSDSMKQILTLVKKIAEVDSTVLILGETGVGKSAIAKVIHQLSKRKYKEFNEINCAALPETLIEAELFGFEGKSFTGAPSEKRKGLIETTNGGTLFLDEIGELPIHLQGKLLHVIQNKVIRPIGSRQSISVDVRIIAATNQDLEKKIKEGKFREDLYYRLLVIPITIPPLRERKEDIIPLVNYFLSKFNKLYDKNVSFSPKVVSVFLDYQWNGNIRELENIIERLVVTADSDEITTRNLPNNFKQLTNKLSGKTLGETIEEIEKKVILESYTKHKSSYMVAKDLGLSQSTANRKIKKYLLTTDSF